MNKATVTIQATRDDDGATWRITVPADVLEQAVNDVWFLSYVNLLAGLGWRQRFSDRARGIRRRLAGMGVHRRGLSRRLAARYTHRVGRSNLDVR